MAKLSPAQILGRAGGKIGGKKKSADQTTARRANAEKARLARATKRDDKFTEDLDKALKDPRESDDTDLHLPHTY